ncbi:MAG: hypothetical protein IJS79_02475 [Oscillospiraceae bacterium]|nr:hypothetical protein [Oscillospiraceae bacterium]
MKIGIKAVLLAAMAAAAAFSVRQAAATLRRAEDLLPKEVYAQFQAKSGRAQYLLREENGQVAVFRNGENRPERVTGIETVVLRRADRAMLGKGIPAENIDEVLHLLEDLGS